MNVILDIYKFSEYIDELQDAPLPLNEWREFERLFDTYNKYYKVPYDYYEMISLQFQRQTPTNNNIKALNRKLSNYEKKTQTLQIENEESQQTVEEKDIEIGNIQSQLSNH